MDINKRIEWIDIAKGIGIILVIAGHTISLTHSYPIYAFHMPLFFFLSGLVAKEISLSFGDYIGTKARQILKPWAILCVISFIVCLLIPTWRSNLSIHQILLDFYSSNTNNIQNSSLWYLVCFYMVLFLYFFLNKFCKGIVSNVVLLIIAVLSLWLPETLSFISHNIIHLPSARLPFKIDTAILALVFFAVANWNKKKIIDVLSKELNLIIVVLLVFICIIAIYVNGRSNLNSLEFGNYRLLYYPVAFIGIMTTCVVSHYISTSRLCRVRSILIFCGKYSLLIFGFQSLFIRLYLLVFNNIEGLDMQLYIDNPIRHQLGAFFTVTFVMSPLVVLLFQTLRKNNIYIL